MFFLEEYIDAEEAQKRQIEAVGDVWMPKTVLSDSLASLPPPSGCRKVENLATILRKPTVLVKRRDLSRVKS